MGGCKPQDAVSMAEVPVCGMKIDCDGRSALKISFEGKKLCLCGILVRGIAQDALLLRAARCVRARLSRR